MPATKARPVYAAGLVNYTLEPPWRPRPKAADDSSYFDVDEEMEKAIDGPEVGRAWGLSSQATALEKEPGDDTHCCCQYIVTMAEPIPFQATALEKEPDDDILEQYEAMFAEFAR